MAWKKHQLVWIEADPSLGLAKIVDDSDSLRVVFLLSGDFRNYTKKNPPFKRAVLHVGQKLKVQGIQAEVLIQKLELKNDLYVFECLEGQFGEADILHISSTLGVVDLLRQKKFTPAKAFHLRKQAWDILRERDSHPLRGAIGCRVQTLPHQLFVVSSALEMPVVRALLADEVGLGKTIEAGLIFSALHARQKLKKVLILVPAALKVQWLSESFRRFNVRFRLDHETLIEEDDYRDFVISSLDELDQNTANYDLLIVDEAHRLVHDTQRAEQLASLVKTSKHVLFLSATPRVHGDKEFLKLIKILGASSEGSLKPLMFQSRRSELGLPTYRQLEAVIVKDKKKWLFEFLSQKITQKEKVFMITSKAEDVLTLSSLLREKLGERFALFHEEMDLVERDRQAAYFADPEGAQFLLSSEIGGEGRNFQFCQNLILLDLPADPLVVEQRIGRLDRLGQTKIVNVRCPVIEESEEEIIFETHRDKFKVFEEPWSGAGLADLKQSALLEQHQLSQSVESLAQKGNFLKVTYDAALAQTLLNSAQALSERPIKIFLEHLYDLFGIEVEDFDTRGNWRVFTSSLMFVDYFPGLGETGERVITFDRAQALAREDMSFFSLDHPDFIECIEFLLNSDQGKLAVASLPPRTKSDLLFQGLFRAPPSNSIKSQLWSYSQKSLVPEDEKLLSQQVPMNPLKLPDAFVDSLPAALSDFLDSPKDELDALLILVQTKV